MVNKQKLAHPAFILAVFLLLLNDWLLKQTFGNSLTGKLSDVTGLFAFPFFFAALFTRFTKTAYLLTLVGFLFWKTPFVQPLILVLNNLGLPVHRVVDYTDYLALIVLPLSYYTFSKAGSHFLKPLLLNLLACIALLTFGATSMPPGKYTQWGAINKTYAFPFSKRELVSRINALQLEYVRDMDKYLHFQNEGLIFNSKNNTFYYSSKYNDNLDTIARILDYKLINEKDTIRLRTTHADIIIEGDSTSSQLKLIALKRYVRKTEKSDPQQKSVQLFEKWVIKKINRYSR
ncbi:hypothetical protein [Mucilaginibacter auburnensis]|uniref:Uncharacterized protein n=1 Tax=Mucilaginibacter auburnensis TaxID=1457233 RepID=A0A2H9VQ17_9SPHI|nr:hypothetical protein [Mucilaginibacter auburnensis]PJJ80402.1 hypothetical protein CLV57_3553 [Mucilaginibacter auburnensis]